MHVRMAVWLLCTELLLGSAGAASADPVDPLPLVRVEAPPGSDGPLVVILSGDGDWVAIMRDLAAAAASAGAPVLGLKSRAYLTRPRSPDELSAALEPEVRAALRAAHRDALVVIGYSRGADFVPFVVNRWPGDLRERVRAIALVGLSEHASFEFHLEDLLHTVQRPTDVPTRPELEKLHGIPITCIRGADESDSFCERPVPGMQVSTHAGGHRATSDDGTIAVALRAVGLAR